MRTCAALAFLSLSAVAGCASGSAHADAFVAVDVGTDGRNDDAPTRDAPLPDTGPPDTGVPPHDTGGIVRVDGGGRDGGCASSAACSDGLVCNGAETCLAGACAAGTPPSCDDGIGCTDDSCVEPGGCVHVLNNMRCPAGQTCTPGGCMAATMCPMTPCRFNPPQCGCPTGQACYATAAAAECLLPGSGASATVCGTSADCAAGNMCVNLSSMAGTTADLCTHICLVDSDCNGGLCILAVNNGMGGIVPNLTLCTHPCNAATQVGCPMGWACHIAQERTGTMRTYTDCAFPPGTGAARTPCTTNGNCAPGLGCIDINDGLGAACHQWCRFPGGACPGTEHCYEFAVPIVINSLDYGVCAP